MDIVINLAPLQAFFSLSPEVLLWKFFLYFGWMILAVLYLFGARELWLIRRRMQWGATNRFIILAIDIPKGNEQTPKAVENFFTYLAGAHGSINMFEKWFEGKYQLSFSLEIVCIDGYTQFLIRTPIEGRNLVESGIYSQYPDAEITEVDDYVGNVPHHFPDEDYDIWGGEFIQQRAYPYPIKLYREFEHQMGPAETQFKDPMAALMDLGSSLKQGEQLWYQLILTPTGFDWVEECDKEVDRILKRKPKAKPDAISKLAEWISNLSEEIYQLWGDISDEKKEEKGLSMMELTPKQKRQVEAIHEKASKLAFKAKLRMVYVARKDVMNKAKVGNGFIGYIKQFAAMDLNNLKPDVDMTLTKTSYFHRSARLLIKKNNLMYGYVGRDNDVGRSLGLYNIEELATLWHFPNEASVRAPMIQKAPGRKAEAPSTLPIFEEETYVPEDIFNESPKNDHPISEDNSLSELEPDTNKGNPPENLPFV